MDFSLSICWRIHRVAENIVQMCASFRHLVDHWEIQEAGLQSVTFWTPCCTQNTLGYLYAFVQNWSVKGLNKMLQYMRESVTVSSFWIRFGFESGSNCLYFPVLEPNLRWGQRNTGVEVAMILWLKMSELGQLNFIPCSMCPFLSG